MLCIFYKINVVKLIINLYVISNGTHYGSVFTFYLFRKTTKHEAKKEVNSKHFLLGNVGKYSIKKKTVFVRIHY